MWRLLARLHTLYPQVERRAAPFLAMPSARRLTALALARALQAGKPTEGALASRIRNCLGTRAPWSGAIVRRYALMPATIRDRLSDRALARLIEGDDHYQAAWVPGQTLIVRRYYTRTPRAMGLLPLGLDRCFVPFWPHARSLADWLAISTGGLWRLTRAADWQRRAHLGEQHYRFRLIAKRTGGMRLLEVPKDYLKPLQRRILDDLLDRIPPHEAACGYTREKSVLTHVAAHRGQEMILRFDLRDFFSSVRASRVHALFDTLGYSESVARELTALCTTATPEAVLGRLRETGSLDWNQVQRLRQPHLPQGAPTSAALANLCCFGLDLRLDGLARSLGARYTRYADDLVISGGPGLRAARNRIEGWVARIATDEGFTLNLRKSRCLPAGRRQSICGVVINEKPNLPREEFDHLKAILHHCVVQGPASQNREGRPQWQAYLRGRVAWAAQINPDKALRLTRLFEAIDWSR